ncbi:MAG: DUF2975 domain-containing protein [Clostridia bacterium]|nr:DUF2975 domain-containing protein [Clostridia bacterium]
MKLADKHGLSGVLEVVLWISMALGAVIIVSLPWSIQHFMMPFNNNPDYWYPRYLITLFVSGVLAELILWQSRRIIHNVNKGTIFSMDTVKRIKIVGVECLVMAAFYIAMLFFGMTKISMAVVLVAFLLAGLVMLIFSELFHQAVNYKQENDMTI